MCCIGRVLGTGLTKMLRFCKQGQSACNAHIAVRFVLVKAKDEGTS